LCPELGCSARRGTRLAPTARDLDECERSRGDRLRCAAGCVSGRRNVRSENYAAPKRLAAAKASDNDGVNDNVTDAESSAKVVRVAGPSLHPKPVADRAAYDVTDVASLDGDRVAEKHGIHWQILAIPA